MSTPLNDQLRAYFDDVDRQQGAADLDALRRSAEEGVIMIELSPDKAVPPNRPTSGRRWPILIGVAAAAVVAIAFAVIRDADDVTPSDEPSPTVTVPPTTPPRPLLIDGRDELEPGTYYVDEVNGTPTPRIFATIGAGWSDLGGTQLWSIMYNSPSAGPPGDTGNMTVSRAVAVFADACHPSGGYNRGPVPRTLDDLVAALTEQQGWAEVTTPTDISIDGYTGKAFQRTAPTDMTDCDREERSNTRVPRVDDGEPGFPNFKSWESPDGIGGGGYYERGQIETLWVVDLDGTVVVIATELWSGPNPDFAADVLDSIRIERT